ncbi:EI24 domain-containing protein [Nitrosophilus alvini]|uniref:EI24 domain-containing protein n=1 Tax=Nitrosophilus alvini TaxID=2714855 RepID=UPI00190CF698|nr:EI24 domain-containing protein [Nitrosophilus alvini]
MKSIVIRSIKDVLSWEIVKFSLMIGIPLAILWIFLGYIFWPVMVSFAYKSISWIPFSIVKANGAFITLFFIWFQAVTVSFALIMAFFNVPIYRYVSKRRYEYLIISIIAGLAVFWAIVIVLNWHTLFVGIEKILTWFPFQTVDEAISWLLAIFLVYNFYILSFFLLVLVYIDPFLDAMREKHYPDLKSVPESSHIAVLGTAVRDAALFALFILIFLPFLFIPFLNIALQLFLWTWLYKESYFLSVCAKFCTKVEYKKIKSHKFSIWMIALFASLLNFLPVVNILAPFFAINMYFHWIVKQKERD